MTDSMYQTQRIWQHAMKLRATSLRTVCGKRNLLWVITGAVEESSEDFHELEEFPGYGEIDVDVESFTRYLLIELHRLINRQRKRGE